MNLLESFEKEIKTGKKVICLTPYDRDFPFIFLTIKEYLECENLSDLWTTGFVEEFEYSYQGENSLILKLEEHHFKKVLGKLDDETTFEELTLDVLKWHFDYSSDTDVIIHIYNYDVYDNDGKYLFYYNEQYLVQDLFEEQTQIKLEDLQVQHDCLRVSICPICFFNQGNYCDMDYENSQKLKIEFIDN